MLEVAQFFKRHFNAPPIHVVRAPGRLELLGNHTDYNDGLVMALAVDKYIEMAATPRHDGKIELVSSAFSEKETFPANEFRKNPAAPWADYVKGVLAQLSKRGVHFSGFSAIIHGTIPMGAGMSSSAALEVATALLVRKLHPYALTETGSRRGANPQWERRSCHRPRHTEKLNLARLCQCR